MTKFDRHTWRRLVSIAKPFFVSELRWHAVGMLLLLVGFSLSVSGLNVLMSYVGRDFMTALSLREKDEFMRQLYRYLFAFACATPVVVFYRYTEERLGLLWRKWLSRTMIDRYFANRSYYKINAVEGIDNPDQRIAEDIRSFTTQSLSFFLIVLNSLIALFAFMGILWSISINLTFAVVLYAACGSVSTYYLGRPLIGLNFAQLKKEADYRYKLINVRDNSESIAFFGGQRKEATRVRQRLKEALNNLLLIINWNRNLNFFTTGYNYLVSILPTVLVAPLYLDGKIEFGVVTQAGFAFAQVLGALSIIVFNFGSLSSYAAVITRLGAFWDAFNELEGKGSDSLPTIKVIQDEKIEFKDVTIYTPKRDQTLVQDLSFALNSERLLITGESGSGKSSIFRIIAGLWTAGQGTVWRPPISKCMFLPQRPYMVLGSLRSQILYAAHEHGISDRTLVHLLKEVGLEEMLRRVGGFNTELDWPNVLSTGEQQRLAFARMLLVRPSFAFLDEATTALDSKTEKLLYSKLKGITKTYISIGYRATLSDYHDVVLDLPGDGTWTIERLKG